MVLDNLLTVATLFVVFFLSFEGKYNEADSLYLRAIEIGERTLPPDHADLAVRFNNRAGLLKAQVRVVKRSQ